MTHVSDPHFLALHASRVRGFSETATIAAFLGVAPDEVAPLLRELGERGLLAYRDGRLSGWTSTPTGRSVHASWLAVDVEGFVRDPSFVAQYDAFMELNPQLLRACTDWQVRDLANYVPNDHTDERFDADVVDRLEKIHSDILPICSQLTGLALRFANYEPRFVAAMTRLRSGDRDWFAKPLIDSYHTVWMELHEDLLLSQRIDRSFDQSFGGLVDHEPEAEMSELAVDQALDGD